MANEPNPASTSTAPAAATAAPPSQAAPAGPPASAQKPGFLPDAFWNAEAGAIKLDDFGKHYTELAEFHRRENERRAALPQKPEDYKFELPADFKLPEPFRREDFRLDEKDPRIPLVRAFAKKHGLSQEAVNELFAIDAQQKIDSYNAAVQFRAAQLKALGDNAQARIEAVSQWLTGLKTRGTLSAEEVDPLLADLKAMHPAPVVSLLEKLMQMVNGSVPGNQPAPLQQTTTPQQKSLAERIWPALAEKKAS
jgi:hypothetical protein